MKQPCYQGQGLVGGVVFAAGLVGGVVSVPAPVVSVPAPVGFAPSPVRFVLISWRNASWTASISRWFK